MRTDAFLAIGFVLMWSSGFIGAVLGTPSAGPWTLVMWRFLVTVPIIAAWWWFTSSRRLSARDVGVHAVIGLLSQGVFLFGVFFSAELGVPAGLAALVAALQPIVTATLSGPLLGEHTSMAQWGGLAVGLGGVALVIGGDLTAPGSAPAAAYALPFLAMAGLVAATFVERRMGPSLPLTDALLVQFSTGAVVFTAIATVTGGVVVPVDGRFWLAVAWLVVFSAFGGYGFYWLNVRRGSVNRVSTLMYLTPPTTMLLGFVMFGERLTVQGLLGMTVCVGAVLLVLHTQRARRSPRELSVPRGMMAACSFTTSSARPQRSRPRVRESARQPCSPSC